MVLHHVNVLVVGSGFDIGTPISKPCVDMRGEQCSHWLDRFDSLILNEKFIQFRFCFAFISLDRKIEIDPFLRPVSGWVFEIEYCVVLIVFDLQTSGHLFAPTSVLHCRAI